MRSTTRITSLSVCLVLLYGCATLPPGERRDPRDPWERLNRTSYKVNDALDRAIVKPTAKAYAKLPQPMRNGFYNFFTNLSYPITIVNDLLQGQFKPFASDIGRLVLNTTLGLGGFLDPATAAGLERNDRDLGQTLGKWGIKPGPYLVVPIFGPYDLRDGIGALADDYVNPRHYTKFWVGAGLWAAEGIDTRSRLLYVDAALQSVYDPYAFVRNAYLQHRQFMVSGGQSQSEEDQEQKLMEEIGESETPAEKPAATPAGAPQSPPQTPPPQPQESSPPPQPQAAPPQQQPQATPPQQTAPPPPPPPH